MCELILVFIFRPSVELNKIRINLGSALGLLVDGGKCIQFSITVLENIFQHTLEFILDIFTGALSFILNIPADMSGDFKIQRLRGMV